VLSGIRWGGLRTKIVAWSFVPTAIILVALALVTFTAYQQVTTELVIERDRDLTRLLASQLATEWAEYPDLLRALARTADIYRGIPAAQRAALKRANNRLAVFDGGALILDTAGTVVATEPERPDMLGQDWSNRICYRELVRFHTPGSSVPVFSNIMSAGLAGDEVVCVAVPITGERGELTGAMVGMFRLGATAVSAFYGEIVKLRIGDSGNTYIVDADGRVIYHSDPGRIGENFSAQEVVQEVLHGQANAIRARDSRGTDIVASFAPLPGTPWGLVIEESWAALTSSSRVYQQYLLLLLVLGIAVPMLVVFVGARRIARPIQELISAAREVARGNFGQTITARTKDEVEELAQQFNLMSAQLQELYAHMEQRVADRTKELAALNAIAATVSQSLDLNEILNDALDKTIQVVEAEAGGIYLLDEKAGVLRVTAQRGFSPQFVAAIDNLQVGEGFSGRVAQSGQPMVVKNVSTDPRLTRMVVREEGLRSIAIVPLDSKGKVLGTLFASTYGHREFSDQGVQLLTSIGHQIGVAIENARFFEAEQRRAEEFRAISIVGHHITSILPVDELLWEIARLLKKTLGFYLVGIGLIEGDELVFKAGAGAVWEAPDFQPPRLKVGQEGPVPREPEGITGWVAHSGESLLVPDVSQEPRYISLPEASEIRSELAVAMRTKDQVIGVLHAQSDHANAFDEHDLAVLQSLANQAAVAIENARFFEAEQRRAEQFQVISEVGHRITSILAVDEVLEQIVRLVQESLGYYQAAIGLIEGDELVFRSAIGFSWDELEFKPLHLKVGQEGITGVVAQSGEPLVVPNVSREPRYYRMPGDTKTQSELAVPLKTKEAVIGVLAVSSDRVDAFDESDLVVLQSLANQAAIAIENARLFDAEQRRAEQFWVISAVGRHITSLLDIDEVLIQVVRLIQKAFDYDHVGIALIEGDRAVYKVGAGAMWDDPQFRFRPAQLKVGQEGITGWVAAMGESLLVRDVSQDPRYVWMRDSKTRSELAVPIKAKGEVIGVLDAQSERVNGFDDSDMVVLQSLANQAGIAIENARLLEAERQRRQEATLLAEMAKLISGTLDLDKVLSLTVKYAVDVFAVQCCCILLYNEDKGTLRLATQIGFDDPAAVTTTGAEFTPSETLRHTVFERLQPLIVEDVPSHPHLSSQDHLNLQSALVVPIEVRGRTLGAIQLGTRSPQRRRFTTEEGELALAMANQAALAIENARLFHAEARRAEQFRVISEVGRRITSILAVDELLDQMANLIQEAFNYYHVGFGLIEGDEVVSKAEIGATAGAYESLRLQVGQEGVWGWVAQSGEPLLVPDVRQDPRFLHVPGSVEIRSQLCVPLKTKEGVIGVLSVESDQLNAFDESDLAVLQSLADQAAVAVENARHHEQAQQVAALEERNRLARDLHDAVTQTLFSASLIAQALPAVWRSDPEEGQHLLKELQQLNRGALAEMRTLLLELRPAALAEARLGDLLRQLSEAVTGRTGLLVTVTVEGQCTPPSNVHVTLYRIAQEALNNVVKHAHASQVTISLNCTSFPPQAFPPQTRENGAGRVELCVSDDGRGFDPNSIPPDRLGLSIIRERAEAVGAYLEIESNPGQGTQVTVVWKQEPTPIT
jgi:GAF domain-containing protein/HAMP domain-containing protein